MCRIAGAFGDSNLPLRIKNFLLEQKLQPNTILSCVELYVYLSVVTIFQ